MCCAGVPGDRCAVCVVHCVGRQVCCVCCAGVLGDRCAVAVDCDAVIANSSCVSSVCQCLPRFLASTDNTQCNLREFCSSLTQLDKLLRYLHFHMLKKTKLRI